jgi:hypothetical protein
MMAGLVLQPSRSMTLGSKGGENLLKENLRKDLSKLEEKSGAAFLVSSDRSVILLGGRRAKDGPDFGASLYAGPDSGASLDLSDGP